MLQDDDVKKYFYQHVVPVIFGCSKGDEFRKFVITTFVLSVSGRCFLVTAGHCLRDIEYLLDSGYIIDSCGLIDFLGLDAEYQHTIPFDYKNSLWSYFEDEESGLDYGIIPLTNYYVELLMANNIKPIDEMAWEKQPGCIDFLWVLGIPSELVEIDKADGKVSITPIYLIADLVSEKPPGFSDVKSPQLYGHIRSWKGLKSIKGMSGGPIFAFNMNAKGELRYWLVGIQSKWLSASHYIAACPAKILGDAIVRILASNGKN